MKHVALLLASCLLLAGCFGGGKDDDDGTATTTSTQTSGAPTAGTIAAALERSTPNGAVPLTVNLTVNATFTQANGTSLATPPTGSSWELTVSFLGNATGNATGNGTGDATGNATGNLTDSRDGTSFPANVTLNLTEAGTYRISLDVTAPGYATGTANVLVIANATGGPGGGAGALFFEGGEADESQWELEDEVVFDAFGAERVHTGESHPLGGWGITDAEAHSGVGSWHAPYPDNYEARMTSIPIPAGGSTLTFWAKGGAEDNGNDGLHILVGPSADELEEIGYQAVVLADWTQLTFPIPSATTVVQIVMFADASCSSDPAEIGGADGTLCGAGWNAGGFYIDDITLA